VTEQVLDVIFAMPHPDDVEITCGGTVARLAKLGYRVGVLCLTNGEPTPHGSPEVRAQELAEAARILGVSLVQTLDLPNRELLDNLAARYAVATFLRRYRPRILVTLAGRTPAASPDHYQAQLIVEAARFYSQLTRWDERFDSMPPHRIDWLWYRPVHIAAEQMQWRGTFVVDVSDVYEQKLAAIAAYKSQFDEQRLERLLHRIRAFDAADGARAGFRYGELYAVPHAIPLTDPVAFFSALNPPQGPPTVQTR